MVLEHDEERALVTWMIEALGGKRVIDFVYSSHRLTALLRSHIDKGMVLQVLAGHLLSNEEDTAVLPSLRTNHKEPEIFVNFPRLEREYRGELIASPLAPRPYLGGAGVGVMQIERYTTSLHILKGWAGR
jgi:hypothetical protein